MDRDLLNTGDSAQVQKYMDKKFNEWNKGWAKISSVLKPNTARYYVSASKENQQVIKTLYDRTFPNSWPADLVKSLESQKAAKASLPSKFDQDTNLEIRTKHKAQCEFTLQELKRWKEENEWQKGPEFYDKLKARVNPLVDGTFDRMTYAKENYARGVMSLTGSGALDAGGLDAQFEYLLGLKAQTEVTFTFDNAYLTGATTLGASMTAGTWGKGSVAAYASKGGIKAEAAIALALGMEAKIEAQSTWKTAGGMGINLGGEATAFIGTDLIANAKLKVTPTQMAARLKADVFAGLRADCAGAVELTYMDETMAKAECKASVTLGAGAAIDIGIETSLFGPTSMDFKIEATKGFGAGFHARTELNFSRMALAGNSKVRDLMSLPTIMRGYSSDLMQQEHLNSHYLDKSIAALEAAIDEDSESIKSLTNEMNGKPSKLEALRRTMGKPTFERV